MKNNKFRLHDKKISRGFEVPEGYFEQLPDRLTEKTSRKPRAAIIKLLQPYAAVAAIFIALFMVWTTVLEQVTQQNPGKPAHSASTTADTYITNYTLDPALVVDFLTDESNFTTNDSLTANEQEAIIDYLAYSEIDYYLLEQTLSEE